MRPERVQRLRRQLLDEGGRVSQGRGTPGSQATLLRMCAVRGQRKVLLGWLGSPKRTT